MREVTPEQYAKLVSNLTRAHALDAKSRSDRLTLAQKLSLKRRAKALRDEIKTIGDA